MFSALKVINSKSKRNLRFVAAGSFQIEFFENEGQDYFTIYRFNYGGEGGSLYYLFNFSNKSITCMSDNEFQFVDGLSTYKIRVTSKNKSHKIYVTRYLWGWLPLSRLGGKASESGLASLRSNLKLYLSDMAA
tara:strand:+ start:334 stop:732 length:399 start_codon:yes stop_codon:yes gene_type:complete